MVRLPPLNWLRAFESVARHSSVSSGARELNVTTSAASQNVKRLEQSLGAPLLSRDGNRVRLSDAGARLAGRLSPAFAMIEEAVAPFETRPAGHVSILAPKAFARAAIAPALAELNAASPLRAWVVNEARTGELFDIEIVRAAAAPVADAVEIGRDAILAVCAPDYQLRREGDAVEGATLLAGPWSRTLWAQWREAAEAPRLVAPQVVAAPSEAVALEAARLGLGLALARSSEAAGGIARRTLTMPFVTRLPATDRYWAIQRGRSAATRHVFSWLVRQFGPHGDFTGHDAAAL
jgi:LysR family glycine cleavage system transcriptional activator